VGFESSAWVSKARLDSGLRGGSGIGGGHFTGFAGRPKGGAFPVLKSWDPPTPLPQGSGRLLIPLW
jgi:hypothetical protein